MHFNPVKAMAPISCHPMRYGCARRVRWSGAYNSLVKTDILIVGGGLVGASLALALRNSAWRVALAEVRPPAAPDTTCVAPWDARVYAISPASRLFLEGLGAWQRLDATRIAPVSEMRVHGDRRSHLNFSAHDAGVVELAWIVESKAIAAALWTALQDSGVELICPATPAALAVIEAGAMLRLDDGRSIEARLVVGADGAHSFVRSAAAIDAQEKSYGQRGVVANFSCTTPHRSVAYQWFRKDGVLAWLPLPGNRMSMVWSTPEEHADELLALDAASLCERVADAGGGRLGALQLITSPAAFPLTRLAARSLIADRVALIGDAAHVVHPLAGQGVNLGFADAAALADVLRHASRSADPGARMLLRRYERARAEDITAMRWATDGLARLFQSRAPGMPLARNVGLNLVHHLPVLKNLLVGRAVGAMGRVAAGAPYAANPAAKV